MCGIVGYARGIAPRPAPPLDAMRDTLQHRGPDDACSWWSRDGRVGLATRRLAIIDLSPRGRQPMLDHSGGFCIAYNGEIYNYRLLRQELERLGHRFRSSSDTEVILEAYKQWGDEVLTRLNGMFAFALYDLERRRLFLARDRAGEKPLYYRLDHEGLVFASELKALMADSEFPRQVDRAGLEQYLAFGYVPGDRCILQGVNKLPPAHAMVYSEETGSLKVWRYWRLPEPLREPAPEPHGLIEELEKLLFESVSLRMVADVPVGILLSGGIDSSLVVAMAARASSRPVRTFTVTFPGHREYDEASYARLVARHFGTDHAELAVDSSSCEILPELASQFDEPLGDSSMVPTYLVSRLIRRYATVALSGDGGDELFGGYHHYEYLQRQLRLQRWLPRMVRRTVSAAASRLLPLGFRGRNYLTAFDDGIAGCISRLGVFFDPAARAKLLAPIGGQAVLEPEATRRNLAAGPGTPVQLATAADFLSYLPDDILVKVDRASMLSSLEVRAPWLDPRIIELAFGGVPESLRVAGGERKILPRRLAARLLPGELDLTRKRGFSMPLAEWLRADWARFIDETLAGTDMIFDRRTVRDLLRRQGRHYRNTERVFALVMFELWRRHYRVGV
jgi:asparagine synthase (glutamine-hydrolysing)